MEAYKQAERETERNLIMRRKQRRRKRDKWREREGGEREREILSEKKGEEERYL